MELLDIVWLADVVLVLLLLENDVLLEETGLALIVEVVLAVLDVVVLDFIAVLVLEDVIA